jgi:hypothetical protein
VSDLLFPQGVSRKAMRRGVGHRSRSIPHSQSGKRGLLFASQERPIMFLMFCQTCVFSRESVRSAESTHHPPPATLAANSCPATPSQPSTTASQTSRRHSGPPACRKNSAVAISPSLHAKPRQHARSTSHRESRKKRRAAAGGRNDLFDAFSLVSPRPQEKGVVQRE